MKSLCVSVFSIAVIKHHDQGYLWKEGLFGAYVSRKVGVLHYNGVMVRMVVTAGLTPKQQLRAVIHTQEAESIRKMVEHLLKP